MFFSDAPARFSVASFPFRATDSFLAARHLPDGGHVSRALARRAAKSTVHESLSPWRTAIASRRAKVGNGLPPFLRAHASRYSVAGSAASSSCSKCGPQPKCASVSGVFLPTFTSDRS